MPGQPNGENRSQPGPLEQAARSLGVPLEKLSTPSVRAFLGFYSQLERMQQQLSSAAAFHPHFFTTEEREREVQNQIASGIAPEQAVEPTVTPSLAERYDASEHLVRAAIHLFREGFNGFETNPEYLRRVVNAAIGRFGLRVEYAPPEQQPSLHPRRERRDHEDINVRDLLRQWANEQQEGDIQP